MFVCKSELGLICFAIWQDNKIKTLPYAFPRMNIEIKINHITYQDQNNYVRF